MADAKAEKVTKVGELEFIVKEGVKMLVRKGRGRWLMVGLEGKDGKLKRFVMKEVDTWMGEGGSDLDW